MIYLLVWVIHAVTLVLLNNKSKQTEYHQARREYVLPNLFAAMLLNLLFGISWIFALIGTEQGIRNTVYVASQYIFGFLIIIHAALVLVMSFARSKDTRNAWLTCCGTVTGKSKSYSVSSQRRRSTKTPEDEGFGMSQKEAASENILYTEASKKEPLPDDEDSKPLTEHTETPTPEPAEGGAMVEVSQEEAEGQLEAETVMTNLGAEDDEDEKKTHL